MRRALAVGLALILLPNSVALSREWTDVSGHYRLTADVIARHDRSVVLEKEDKNLVVVNIDQLSEVDQQYLESKEGSEAFENAASASQTWTMRNGLKVKGTVVDYAQKTVTIQRRHAKLYVNDTLFKNLPEVYRRMIPEIVAEFEKEEVDGERGLLNWAVKQKGQPRDFVCEGVMLELENGDLYGVPFFFFSADDLKVLKPGWDEWLAAHQDAQRREDSALQLRAQAVANQKDRAAQRNMARLQLQLTAYDAGVFDLWEVTLFPPQNVGGLPVYLVVPGRNSAQAANAALMQYPNYVVGSIAKARRRY